MIGSSNSGTPCVKVIGTSSCELFVEAGWTLCYYRLLSTLHHPQMGVSHVVVNQEVPSVQGKPQLVLLCKS